MPSANILHLASYLIAAALSVAACAPTEKANDAPPAKPTYYQQDVARQMRLTMLDPTGEKLGECVATYLEGDILAAPLACVRGAHSVRATTMTARAIIPVYGYTLYDFAANVCLLRVGKRNSDLRPLYPSAPHLPDTLMAVEGTYTGKMLRRDVLRGRVPEGVAPGSGLFDEQGRLAAVTVGNGKIVSSATLDSLRQHQQQQHRTVYELRLKSDRVYPTHEAVAACRVETSLGSFTLRLFDDVPEYADNFIRLVVDHYYDSLLVHRVLPNFLIQTGAADTKYAKADDVVGWQGPGYTLPLTPSPQHWHAAGAVAASKLPPDRNPHNRSDGGQFYVVVGRTFTPTELDKLEAEQHKHFSQAQRHDYTTQGGAPYLDGDYVVFAQVSAGMEVVRRIAAVPVNGDRPINDIRVKRISLIKK